MKIDEKVTIPLIWLFSAIAASISITTIGAFWVSTVDYRLERIEEKLGIPRYTDNLVIDTVNSAWGAMPKKDNDR